MSYIADLGMQAGSQAVSGGLGAIMGLMMEKHNDNRQYEQQMRLQNLGIAGQKELMSEQMKNQLSMWEATNYKAQMEQMTKAGLNPGLMYGMGGGGGQTIGGGMPSTSGGHAEQNPGEVAQFSGMGLQLGMQAAQLELIKAQARNLDADTKNKGGVIPENIQSGTELNKAQAASLIQGIENQKVQAELTKSLTTLNQLDAIPKAATLEEQITKYRAETSTAVQNARIAMNEADISDETIKDKIKIIKQEAIGKALDNTIKRWDIKIKPEQLNAIKESINNMNSLRQLKWNEQERQALHQQIKDSGIEDGQVEGILDNIINGIIHLF